MNEEEMKSQMVAKDAAVKDLEHKLTVVTKAKEVDLKKFRHAATAAQKEKEEMLREAEVGTMADDSFFSARVWKSLFFLNSRKECLGGEGGVTKRCYKKGIIPPVSQSLRGGAEGAARGEGQGVARGGAQD